MVIGFQEKAAQTAKSLKRWTLNWHSATSAIFYSSKSHKANPDSSENEIANLVTWLVFSKYLLNNEGKSSPDTTRPEENQILQREYKHFLSFLFPLLSSTSLSLFFSFTQKFWIMNQHFLKENEMTGIPGRGNTICKELKQWHYMMSLRKI